MMWLRKLAKESNGATFASTADPDHKVWEYRLISDDNIKLGNTCKYTLGTAHRVEEG